MFSVRRIASALFATLLLAVPAATLAQDARVAQQLKLRQSAYTVIGSQMALMGAMASGRAPYDAAAMRVAADRANAMIGFVPELFPAGSVNANSKAKPELWQQQAEFTRLMRDMQAKSTALVAATRSNDLETIKPAVGALGGTCKACHDKYKMD